MRGVYTAKIKIATLAASKTLLLLTAPATAVVEIIGARITNSSNTTNQQLECRFRRVTTFSPAAGTSVTPAKEENGDQASASTVLGNLSAEPGAYTANADVGDMGWSSLGGYFFQPMPEERPTIPPSGSIGLFMDTAPTAMDTEVEVTYREIG